MKRILFITAFPPNSNTAGQAFTKRLLEDLANYFQVDLVYWGFKDHLPAVTKEIRIINTLNNNRLSALKNTLRTFHFPLFSKRYNKSFSHWLKNHAEEYDALYFDFSQTFIYAHEISHPCKIAMCHDVISQKMARSKLLRLTNGWVGRSERTLLRSMNHIFTFSSKDTQIISSLYRLKSTPIAFYLDPKISEIDVKSVKTGNYHVMYGAWNREENLESLRWVIENLPDDQCVKIIGGGMSPDMRETVSRKPNMELMGFVDNPYPIIAKAKSLIAPLFNGAGVKVKAIEALSLGIPVIGTDVTFEGLPELNVDYAFKLSPPYNNSQFAKHLDYLGSLSQSSRFAIHKSFMEEYSNRPQLIEILKEIV